MTVYRLMFTLALCCFSCCLSAIVFSQEQISDMPAGVDWLAAEYFGEGRPIVGGVIGVVNGPQCYAKGYGRVSLDDMADNVTDDATVPDIDTVYEIASLSKTFTGVLLGEMAARNELAIDDPLEKFVPSGVAVLRYEGHLVTLRQLATHSSGLPRLPTDFWNVAGQTPDNPYKNYTGEKIAAFLNSHQPTVAPDTRYEYSNLGASVLGWVFEQKTDMSYEQLVQERIGKPLGMKSTAVELTESMRERLAPPYHVEKERVSNWDLPGFAGGGGLRSTMRDMLRFAQASAGVFDAFPELLGQLDHPLVTGMKTAGELHFEDAAAGRKMGLGWHINDSALNSELTHNGQTGGYRSFIIVCPKTHRAVVVLTNTAVDDADRLGEAVWNDFDQLFDGD